MDDLLYSGSCQCGECKYAVDRPYFVAYTCHCKTCQKLTSSAFMSCLQIAEESFHLVDGHLAQHQRIANSGNTLTNSFCGRCASLISVQNSARPRIRTITIGTLDKAHEIEVNAHIWVRRKLPWVTLPDNHRIFRQAADWSQDYASDPARYKP